MFMLGSLLPDLIDIISHAVGFVFGCILGIFYLKLNCKLQSCTESEARIEVSEGERQS